MLAYRWLAGVENLSGLGEAAIFVDRNEDAQMSCFDVLSLPDPLLLAAGLQGRLYSLPKATIPRMSGFDEQKQHIGARGRISASLLQQSGAQVAFAGIREDDDDGLALIFRQSRQLPGHVGGGPAGDAAEDAFGSRQFTGAGEGGVV